jgi:uncharacterized membrane protein YdjX (TVP38/TMEM64 family)
MPVRPRHLATVALIACAAAVALLVPHDPHGLRTLVDSAGPLAPLVFTGAAALLTVVLFPGTLLAAAAGIAFGPFAGGALALAGTTAGGTIAFLLTRCAGLHQRRVLRSQKLRRIVERLDRGGILAVAATRAAPGVPATGLHYALGATRIRLPRFVAGIALGAASRTFVYAAAGGALGSHLSPATAALLIAPPLLSALVLVLVRLIRRHAPAPAAAA